LFTAGALAHYLVLPFLLFFAIHFLYVAIQRKWHWPAIAYPAAACTVLIATWGIYLLATFGPEATVTANSTVGGYSKEFPLHYRRHASDFLGNLITTTFPYTWRLGWEGRWRSYRIVQADPDSSPDTSPTDAELNMQTEWFSALSNNPSSLLGVLGIAGMIGVVTAAVRAIWRPRKKSSVPTLVAEAGNIATMQPGWKFWLIFFTIGIPFNIMLSTEYFFRGAAHLNLQPYACLTVVWLFRTLGDLSKWIRAVLVAIFLIESALISGAIMHLQERTVPMIMQDGRMMLTSKRGRDEGYVNNYRLKLNKKAVFISDRLGDLTGPFALIAVVISMGLLSTLKQPSRR
jgi:hypothetical protein